MKEDKNKKLAERKKILKYLEYGICPDCGHDTERKYCVKVKVNRTYCSNKSCKFYDRTYQDDNRWLIYYSVL